MDIELTDRQLFDQESFNNRLAGTDTPLKLFKEAYNAGHQILNESFIAGVDVDVLVHKRAWLIDQLLVAAWNHIINTDEIALVAVGGYGRNELHPCSDIDIMILERPRRSKFRTHLIEKFLVFLWDIGLEVGHSVRSVRDCVRESRNDITVVTNLMEARLICGNRELFNEMREKTGPEKIWKTRKFFEAKWQEQIERHQKYNDSDHKLEPNIKEGPGGLRDIQMIGWVAKRYFGADTLYELVRHDFLTEEEYQTLESGQSLLWRIRYALHYITGRREDKLLFDYQKNVAELFGFYSDDNSAVEQFMKMYYQKVRELNLLNEILLQHFQEAIIFANRKEKVKTLNKRFRVRNNYIDAVRNNVFTKYPFALLEIFLLIQQTPSIKGVRASTIRLIRNNCDLIDADFRDDIRNRSLFMEIIRQPRQVGHQLRRMHRYGILGAYLPAFGKIEGLMQFDLFHVYTVDEHILFVVQNMRLFGLPENAKDYPLYYQILQTLPKQELLYLAGLFHDIAKGRGGDHSELGAIDAGHFCKKHGLSNYDAKLVAWLVEKHLLMSKTATRKDIGDPEVINRFASEVTDINHLNYLYLLTVADVEGTNPSLWNNWKETLFAELYYKTLSALRRGLGSPLNKDELIRDTRREALDLLKQVKNWKPKFNVKKFWDGLGDDYFLRHSPDEIAWHTRSIDRHRDRDKPLVVVREETSRGGTEVFIFMKNRDNIFAASTQALDKLGLTIVDARIITTAGGDILDTFIVLERSGEVIKGRERKNEIIDTLTRALTTLDTFTSRITRTKSRKQKLFPIKTSIGFSADESNDRTIMEVIASDRPGFLSKIGVALQFCGVRLQGAKIATYGARVEDIFFITDKHDHLIEDPIKFECLRNSIADTLRSS